MTPGILAQSVLFVAIFSGLALIWERDLGIIHKLFVSPTPRAALVLGKALAAGVRSFSQVVIVYTLAVILGVHMNWDPLALLGVVAAVLIGAACFATLSLIIASLVRTRERFMPGVDTVPFLNNSSMMSVDFLPRHLVIVGGSYIGLEFAQMFRRFGSDVTVIEMAPRLIPREDEDVSASIKQILEQEGIAIRLNAKCIRLRSEGQDVVAGVDCEEGAPEVQGSHLLLAVGRRPNTDDLGLDKAGVAVDERGYITVDDELQTSVPGIWALGDCNGKGAFTHTSFNDGEIVAANLLDSDRRRVSDRIQAYALYIDPPLGRAGMAARTSPRSARSIARILLRSRTRAVRMNGRSSGAALAIDAAASSRGTAPNLTAGS